MDEKRTGYISIGEMAKMNRTTVPTLRLYDSMNLLTPCYVDEKTCYRYYDIKQNARLDMIQYMKELGMDLVIKYRLSAVKYQTSLLTFKLGLFL